MLFRMCIICEVDRKRAEFIGILTDANMQTCKHSTYYRVNCTGNLRYWHTPLQSYRTLLGHATGRAGLGEVTSCGVLKLQDATNDSRA